MQQDARSTMLGTMPMTKLIPKISLPIMISMMVQALYNVVDSIYVARYDPDALTAVSLAFPFQMLMVALGVGMAVGIASLLSRKLGEGDAAQARRASWNGFVIEASGFLLFALVGLFLAPVLIGLVVNPETLKNAEKIRWLGETYLSIVTTWSFGLFMALLMERFLQSTGNTTLSMITQISGAVTNIILDPILIFESGKGPLGMGVAGMGIAGAAVATVIGQWVSAAVGFTLNQTKNAELRMDLRDFKIDPVIIRAIMAVGFPAAVMQAIGSVMNVGMNAILSGFADQGNAAVNVLNIYFKLQSFIFMPCFGLGAGMIAIVGYNYGARLRERVYSAIHIALRYAVIIMAVGMLVFQVFPGPLMSVFSGREARAETAGAASLEASVEVPAVMAGAEAGTEEPLEAKTAAAASLEASAEAGGEASDDQEASALVAKQMGQIGPGALRSISLCFILAAIGITLSNVFQALGKGLYSMILSICRQLLVLLPSAMLLKAVFGTVDAVWWSFLIAEGVSCVICLLFYRKIKRDVLDKL